jgi:hypothetical protein
LALYKILWYRHMMYSVKYLWWMHFWLVLLTTFEM